MGKQRIIIRILLLLILLLLACDTSVVEVPIEETTSIDSTLLWSATAPCDYLIITHESLANPAFKLASYRKSNSNDMVDNPLVVTISMISNEFTRQSNQVLAIKDFLKELQNKPKFLVLFSDIYIKPRLDIGIPLPDGYRQITTTMQFQYDNFYSTLYCDSLIDIDDTTMYEHKDNDIYLKGVDFYVGRIPVSTEDEGYNYVNKLMRFEENELDNVFSIVDDGWKGKYKDPVDFMEAYKYIDSSLVSAANFNKSRSTFFLDDFSEDTTKGMAPQERIIANNALVDSLNHENRLVVFEGHSDHKSLTDENVLNVHDVHRISTTSVWISGGCYNNDFSYEDSFAKKLLVSEAGAVVMIASYPTAYFHEGKRFISYMLNSAFGSKYGSTLGDIFHHRRSSSSEYVYLGDPAIVLY